MQAESEIKTILIGDCNTGKTTLFRAFIDGNSSASTQPTVAFDCTRKTVHTDSYGTIVFQLWDTAGAEKFNRIALTQTYYRHTEGVLLIFSVTDRVSFENITEVWLRRLRSSLQLNEQYRCILIGNKADLVEQRVVAAEEALTLATQLGMDYVELSSLHSTDTEIQQPFMMLAVQVIDARPEYTRRPTSSAFKIARALGEPLQLDEKKQDVEQSRCCINQT